MTSAKPYLPGGRTCQICITEKTAIAKDTSGSMLNKRRKVYDETIQVKDYETYLGDIITNNVSNDRKIVEITESIRLILC